MWSLCILSAVLPQPPLMPALPHGRSSARAAGARRTAPEFPARLRDLLTLPCSPPGGGRFSTTWRSPASFLSPPRARQPLRWLPAPSLLPPPSQPLPPPPPPAREWSAGSSRPVTGTRRHKELSKQDAERRSSSPFIKPGLRGRGRRPPTRRLAARLDFVNGAPGTSS